MHKLVYISFLVLFFFSAAQAQDKKYIYRDTSLIKAEGPVKQPATEQLIEQVSTEAAVSADKYQEKKPDTALYMNSLNLPVDSIRRWKELKEFGYAKYLDSLLRAAQEKKTKSETESRGPGVIDSFLSSSLLSILLWALAIAFVLVVLYRLFLADGVFKRASKSVKQAPEVEEELITAETDFDNLINQSVQNGNYRLAVRYQYLKTLHKLAEKNFVELAKDKTNVQYVSEIANPVFRNEFASLTLNYEYVWYGEFAIDKNIYQKIENGFAGLDQKI